MPVVHVSWSKGMTVLLTQAKGQDKFVKKSPPMGSIFSQKPCAC